MKSICLYFQIHQPWRLKSYRFFNIGHDHDYIDERASRAAIEHLASSCYLPMNTILLSLINSSAGAFRCSFSISGVAIEQFRRYAPEVLKSFERLSRTGCVEFLAEGYSHSLSSLTAGSEFEDEVRAHREIMEAEFGVTPRVFKNTELIYNDILGDRVAKMGFGAMISDGSSELLEWRSANYLYRNAINSDFDLLLRNQSLSDDFANGRLWVPDLESSAGDVINLFVGYDSFSSGSSFDAFRSTIGAILCSESLRFECCSEALMSLDSVAELRYPHLVSWHSGGISDWLGNELQDESFVKLHAMYNVVSELDNKVLLNRWHALRSSDHLYYMATMWLTAGAVDDASRKFKNPYNSSYEAFINFMNILSDFELELSRALDEEQQHSLDAISEEVATTPHRVRVATVCSRKSRANVATL